MNLSEFLRIEREGREGSRHYVLHLQDPKFSIELAPDPSAPDRVGRGVMMRLCVPNSWAGDYTSYAKYLNAAQEVFEKTLGRSASSPAPSRRRR
ncbi:MAG: hypothetical protein EXS38_00960 [Opitutus sp.]|nr:hypothetical protein [Opitutus sp.]